MIDVTIITVNRNDEEGLEKTIKSVLGQTYTNYQYVVIDGDSDDGSRAVIDKYTSGIHYWISEPDNGIFHAMNKGIRLAAGKYCHFLNAGDIFVSDNVLKEVFDGKEYSAPFIVGNQINNFGDSTGLVKAPNRYLTLYDFYWGTIKHQATFIRRDLFEKYGMYDESLKIISDWKFFLQVIGLHNQQPEYVDVDIVNFAWYGMSTDQKMQQKHDLEKEKVLSECIPPTIRADYEKLHDLSNYEYVISSMKRQRLYSILVKGLTKIFR